MSGGTYLSRTVLSFAMFAASAVLMLKGEPAAAAWAIGVAVWVDPEDRSRA